MFKLVAPYKPAGDQPKVIEQLVKGIKAGMKHQVLLGVTGSGKTFVIANVINAVQKPTLIISHNKTLAAQLAAEFRDFFPNNAVCYFVSYYDYYQPEAYVPQQDMYIEKDVDINEEIEKYRNSATQAVLTRRDVIVVATVSCIYGLGNPEDYLALSRTIRVGDIYRREKLLLHLINLQYARTKSSISPRQFRVRGDTFEIFQPSGDVIVRIEFFGDEVERIELIDYVTGEVVDTPATITIFPATHYVAPEERLQTAIEKIQEELKDRVRWFEKKGKIVEAQRLKQRTEFDLEMIKECGYCKGIENYSRYIDGRLPGTHPSTLLDYFPDDYLLIIDESHITIPQIRGMYNGDLSRKKTLVDYGFRLPSALDNRPLKFKEFERYINQAIYMSATPAEWEINQAQRCLKEVPKIKGYPTNGVVELLVRPTGLLDPIVEVRPTKGQIKDLIEEIKKRVRKKQRVLVTTMTKRMAEDLTEYLNNHGIKVQYLHSDVETIERTEILLNLREGKYDVVVGINLLREGLDLPEVSLVAILDADKEGFLRSDTSLIQIMGRAARHVEGKVIMYADEIKESMRRALDEAKRRRRIQEKYNKIHNIVPKSIKKEIKSQLERSYEEEREKKIKVSRDVEIENGILFVKERPIEFGSLDRGTLRRLIHVLEDKMEIAAKNLEFEKAAIIRDKIYALKRSL